MKDLVDMKYNAALTFLLSFVLFSVTSAQSSKKVAYGILFDNTGSMRQLIPRQHEIAGVVLKQLKNGSNVSVYGFAGASLDSPFSKFATGLECSTDMAAVKKQIDEIGVVGGQTTLIDAIQSAVERLKNPVAQQCGKSDEQILIVMSDGEDRASTAKPDDLMKFAKESGVKLYVIGLVEELSSESGFLGKSPSKKAKEFLSRIAAESGGRIVFPKKRENADEIVTRLFSENYVLPK